MDLVAQNVFFSLIAMMMVVAAVRVVTTRNIVHAALWLVLVLAGVAGQYILLIAEFTAVVQVMVYIGAIIVLFLFGIMLTRAPLGDSLEIDRQQVLMGLAVAVPLAALLGFTLWDSWEDTEVDPTSANVTLAVEDLATEADADGNLIDGAEIDRLAAGTPTPLAIEGSNTKAVSDSIFGDYLIAFEAISVLLLAALIGAIVLARKD